MNLFKKILNMNKNYLEVRWICGRHTIGIIAKQSIGGVKVYIGVGQGLDEEEDIQFILDYGTKMVPDEAKAFFPTLANEEWEDD